MRTTIDLPDALLKHLKARAALEGRTLRDVVVALVEQGLAAPPPGPALTRVQARPVVAGGATGTYGATPWPADAYTNAALFQLVHGDG